MEKGQLNATLTEEGMNDGQGQPTIEVLTVILLIFMAILPALLIFSLLGLSYFILINAAIEPYSLLIPSGGPINYFVLAIWIFIAAILIPLLCLFIPALSAFLFNLVKPLTTNWLRAGFSSSIFLLIFIITFLGNIVIMDLPGFTRQISVNLYKIIGLGMLLGVGMSVSLGLCGRLGALVRTKDQQPR